MYSPGLSSPYLTISLISLPFMYARLILSNAMSDQNTYPFSWWKSRAIALGSPSKMESNSDLSGNILRMSTLLANIRYAFPPEKHPPYIKDLFYISYLLLVYFLSWPYWIYSVASLIRIITHSSTESDSLIRKFSYPESQSGNGGVRISEVPLYRNHTLNNSISAINYKLLSAQCIFPCLKFQIKWNLTCMV